MKVEFWGVRGSFPVPGAGTVKYGGNTTCVSFTKEFDGRINRVVIDCGTGAVNLGRKIMENFHAGRENLNIIMLFTHLHPDHTQGFPFFAPNYFSQCEIHLMGMRALKLNIGMVLEQTMLPPTFPIEYKDLRSTRKHYQLRHDEQFYVMDGGEFTKKKDKKDKKYLFKIEVMQTYAPSHPQQGALYYIVTDIDTGRRAACIWDLESKLGGDKAVINFTKDCDIMIHDTQYTTDEYNSDRMIVQGFGHSTYSMAIENAAQAGIKSKLICTHFNTIHTDARLDEIQGDVNKIAAKDKLPFEIMLAREGLELEV